MSEYCKGCGVKLQSEDPKALGYAPSAESEYCQRCYKMRHYGDVTINMQKGIAVEQTLGKINDLDGTVFWTVDLFNLESNLVPHLNRRLPGKNIVLVLTKRDVLPSTLTDDKIRRYVSRRLAEEDIHVEDILIAGYMTKKSPKSEKILEEIEETADSFGEHKNVIFMGMANSGKSTLVNRLLDSTDLTISRNPGTTLDVISREWKGRTLYDTPGLENDKSVLSQLPTDQLKTVIPVKPLKPCIFQIYEDQSFAAGGLARMDVVTSGKASVVGYFSLSLPLHRGKLADADRLWNEHLGEMLAPALDSSMDTMAVWHAPKLKTGQKMDVVIQGLGWFTVSGDIRSVTVYAHKGIQVTFRKAMI